jgi:hypothetical protein
MELRKLELLRDCYNDGWVADFEDLDKDKFTISFMEDRIHRSSYSVIQKLLNFKTAELRDKFLENFKDIIEIAKPLL